MTDAMIRTLCIASILSVSLAPMRLAAQRSSKVADTVGGLTATIAIKGAATLATNDALTASGDITANYLRNAQASGPSRQITRFKALSSYDERTKKNASPVITRIHSGLAQYFVYLPGGRDFAALSGRVLHNNLFGLQLQQVYGLALGREIEIDAGRISGEIAAGPSFVHQDFSTADTTRKFMAASLGQSISITLNEVQKIELTESVRALVPVRKGDPLHVASQAELNVPLVRRVALVLAPSHDYLSSSPAGFDKHYFTTSVGLTIKLGPI